MQYKIDIGGAVYQMRDIKSVTITQPLFKELSVGNACVAELEMNFWPKGIIPRMARIAPFCRREETEDWTPLGVFYIDTRETTGDLMHVIAYDSMMKSETIWTPRTGFTFPCTMEEAVRDCAASMGVELDPRSVFQPYVIPAYPEGDYSRRDLLRDTAAAHGGNWIMTAEDKLLLIPLFSALPPETHYLVTEGGSAITFGGTRILI